MRKKAPRPSLGTRRVPRGATRGWRLPGTRSRRCLWGDSTLERGWFPGSEGRKMRRWPTDPSQARRPSRSGVALAGDLVVVSVAAPPVQGQATEAARRALAGALGIAPSRVVLRLGRGSRTKVFGVAGLYPEE